jgi:Fic family protein
VYIGGAVHQPPDFFEVPALMHELMEWFEENKDKLHPVELAAIFHHKLVYIHPFFDGNGRTSRLVMNLLLMSKGYPLVIILKNDRKIYYKDLQKADVGDYKSFVNFIAQAVERTLDIYIKVLTPSKEVFISLSELAKQTPFSDKYLNLLARSGKLEAHKIGRNWLSSIDAFNRYQQTKQKHSI